VTLLQGMVGQRLELPQGMVQPQARVGARQLNNHQKVCLWFSGGHHPTTSMTHALGPPCLCVLAPKVHQLILIGDESDSARQEKKYQYIVNVSRQRTDDG
jgi:hypothetical protein